MNNVLTCCTNPASTSSARRYHRSSTIDHILDGLVAMSEFHHMISDTKSPPTNNMLVSACQDTISASRGRPGFDSQSGSIKLHLLPFFGLPFYTGTSVYLFVMTER